MSAHVAPYTKDFVLDKTFATLRENLAFSVTKTVQRSNDFDDDPEKVAVGSGRKARMSVDGRFWL